MLEAFGQGLIALFQPAVLLVMVVGVLVGTMVGIIPGIGSTFVIAIMIPFVFRMPPEQGIGLLVAASSVVGTAGCITAILLSIPGTAFNVPTIINGYAMTLRGEGDRAIGAGLTASMVGGVLSVFISLLVIPLVTPIVLAFKTPEMFMLIVLGLVFIVVLTEGSVIKGLISGLLGVILALVGVHASTGTARLTFGNLFLYNGLDLATAALGLFGIGSLLEEMAKGQTAVRRYDSKTKMRGVFQGVRDWWTHKWLFLRCTVIGWIVGVIPGIGGSVASWAAYGHAKQTTKDPEFDKEGSVEGVIGPESADNACAGGALLTTMTLGIPGSPGMAVMMAAFFMVGVTPGPSMLTNHLPLAFTLLAGIALANLMAGIFALGATPYLVKLARVPMDITFPVLMVVMLSAAFLIRQSLLNVVAVLVFGILGFLIQKFGYHKAALTLGIVLGELFEHYLNNSVKLYGPTFFLTPVSLIVLVLVVLVLLQSYLKTFRRWMPQGAKQG